MFPLFPRGGAVACFVRDGLVVAAQRMLLRIFALQ